MPFLLSMTPSCLDDSMHSCFRLKDKLLPRIIGKCDFNCPAFDILPEFSYQSSALFFFEIVAYLYSMYKNDCESQKSNKLIALTWPPQFPCT